MAELERLVLSGELFRSSGTSSPPRSPSPDAGWHDDELNLSDDGKDYDSDTARRAAFDKHLKDQEKQKESIGMGPGRTGVKGVIRDRDEAEELQREKRARDLASAMEKMEKTHLGGKTYLEEEREKGEDADPLVLAEREKMEGRRNVFGETRKGRFGHLREVGVKGFLHAVEGEMKGTWVVVHLYEPSLDRCYLLDDALARLARIHPNTKFLRARASALGFTSTASPPSWRGAQIKYPARVHEDDTDDPYDEKDFEDEEEEEDIGDDDVDLDVLPTMLVYRDGELVHNWVRVDWEAGKAGIEELLDRHHILPQSTSHSRNLGLPSDDEDDLIWSDDENGLI
ncbi:Phosducin domain-containing protein [Mycena sanguinolenta]|uniref:Phosducin domain-containing protein n=1 Tax=Mycena sanguinolenta TaxID=230812 RepID=A0A8H6ZG83_9AGAR|nr:Phosducin domain-containing protein [Mycena sanguinolenta]